MNFEIEGRVGIVAGADGDIGRAVAKYLAHQGAHLGLLGRPGSDVEEYASSLQRDDLSIMGYEVDFHDPRSIEGVVGAASDALGGRLDFLVNNLVIEDKDDFLHVSVASWDRQFEYMARAPFFLSQAAAPSLQRDSGTMPAIINIGSVAGIVFWPRTAAYNAARGALIATTGTLAVDLAPLGIRVNGIAAGHVETEMEAENLADPADRARTIQEVPIGRLGLPDEVAAVAMFLISQASSYVLGQTLVVDGGYTLR